MSFVPCGVRQHVFTICLVPNVRLRVGCVVPSVHSRNNGKPDGDLDLPT